MTFRQSQNQIIDTTKLLCYTVSTDVKIGAHYLISNFLKEMERDQQFLEYVVKALVDTPDDVKVNRTIDQMGVLLTLDVNPKDLGQVIGRNGRTAIAIRTLLKVVGAKNQARVNLKINEPEGGRRERSDRGEVRKPSNEVTDEDVANLNL